MAGEDADLGLAPLAAEGKAFHFSGWRGCVAPGGGVPTQPTTHPLGGATQPTTLRATQHPAPKLDIDSSIPTYGRSRCNPGHRKLFVCGQLCWHTSSSAGFMWICCGCGCARLRRTAAAGANHDSTNGLLHDPPGGVCIQCGYLCSLFRAT